MRTASSSMSAPASESGLLGALGTGPFVFLLLGGYATGVEARPVICACVSHCAVVGPNGIAAGCRRHEPDAWCVLRAVLGSGEASFTGFPFYLVEQ